MDRTGPGPEALLQHAVRKELGRGNNFRLLRFNVGGAKDQFGRVISFGVPGFPDLAGILGSPVLCPGCGATVRERDGRWIGLELKSPEGRVSDEQKNFHAMVERFGGRIAVVRSLEEARSVMRAWGAVW